MQSNLLNFSDLGLHFSGLVLKYLYIANLETNLKFTD